MEKGDTWEYENSFSPVKERLKQEFLEIKTDLLANYTRI